MRINELCKTYGCHGLLSFEGCTIPDNKCEITEHCHVCGTKRDVVFAEPNSPLVEISSNVRPHIVFNHVIFCRNIESKREPIMYPEINH